MDDALPEKRTLERLLAAQGIRVQKFSRAPSVLRMTLGRWSSQHQGVETLAEVVAKASGECLATYSVNFREKQALRQDQEPLGSVRELLRELSPRLAEMENPFVLRQLAFVGGTPCDGPLVQALIEHLEQRPRDLSPAATGARPRLALVSPVEPATVAPERLRLQEAGQVGLSLSSAEAVPGKGLARTLRRMAEDGKVLDSVVLSARSPEALEKLTLAAAQLALARPRMSLERVAEAAARGDVER